MGQAARSEVSRLTNYGNVVTQSDGVTTLFSVLIVGTHLFSVSKLNIGQQHGKKQEDQTADTHYVPCAVKPVVGYEVLR